MIFTSKATQLFNAIPNRSSLNLLLQCFALLVLAQPGICQTHGDNSVHDRSISPADLRPGDVLLYHMNSAVGYLIVLFDGGPYGHASIYDNGQTVLEATERGITKTPLTTSVKNAHADGPFGYVDVYRLCDRHKCLGDSGFDPQPVTKWIDVFAKAGGDYAYDDLIMLAGICLIRRDAPIFKPILFLIEPILKAAIDHLNSIIAQGRCIMICSELVYRCFAKAGGRYVLRVPRFQIEDLPPPETKAEKDFVKRYNQAKVRCPDDGPLNRPNGPIPNFVTPFDLQQSNLKKIGRLETTP